MEMMNVTINQSINELLCYGIHAVLIKIEDIDFVANGLLDLFQVDQFDFEVQIVTKSIDEILAPLLDAAHALGLIENDTIDERDLFDTRLMGYLTPRPSEVNEIFSTFQKTDPKRATNYFYRLSKATNYIRSERVKKDKHWKVMTQYGEIDISINLSKPEKDPKTIAMAKSLPSSGYPKCVLCKENVGYAGHLNHPARQNHRIVPVELTQEAWYLQYSPYVYYNEHCILLKEDHVPMAISRRTFERLLDFVSQFKHYFAGSNADLPIVGGSILSHDHFQGGSYTFAMDNAEVLHNFNITEYPGIGVELLKWPLTTLRLKGEDLTRLSDLGEHILENWRQYSDTSLGIYAYSKDVPHNTITPIARFRDGLFELDLVLRNNRTSAQYPDGIFHPHEKYHHLKKENIGLIEVMGLAILPGRLVVELDVIKEALVKNDPELLVSTGLEKHSIWLAELFEQKAGEELTHAELDHLIKQSIGIKFAEILTCCGVYKLDEAGLAGVERFVASLS